MPRKHRPEQCMDYDFQINVGPYLAAVHPTLKDHDCIVSAGAYDPFAEQLEQLGLRRSSTSRAPIMAKLGPRSSAT